MKLPRRRFLHLAVGAAALPAVARIARAQTYPARPVRIIVGYPPGGATDAMARLIAQQLSERLGQQFIVDNRPGAGSNIAAEEVVVGAPDGYTLLLIFSANAISATLYDKLSFNFIRDIAPVASVARSPFVMEVHPSVPAKTVPEFIAYAKTNPGKIRMASNGNGTTAHVAGELFKLMAGVDMEHVPYRGPVRALTDLLAGKGAGQIRHTFGVDGVHQDGQAARAGGNHSSTLGNSAGYPDRGRVRAGLRGERIFWDRRSEEYVGSRSSRCSTRTSVRLLPIPR